jgi:hypothetical protein
MISLTDLIERIEHQHSLLAAYQIELDTCIITAEEAPGLGPAPAHHVDLDTITPRLPNPLAAHPVSPTHNSISGHVCAVPYAHDCYAKNYGIQEGELITLWAYLQYPEDRARQSSWNVRRFRRAKEVFGRGMGNGGSPLRREGGV